MWHKNSYLSCVNICKYAPSPSKGSSYTNLSKETKNGNGLVNFENYSLKFDNDDDLERCFERCHVRHLNTHKNKKQKKQKKNELHRARKIDK